MKAAFSRPAVIVLVCAALVVTLALGTRSALGLLLKPISSELGLGREVFSFAVALGTLITGFGGPVIGALADRIGALRIVLLGGVLTAVSLVLSATAHSGLSLQLTFGLVNGLGMTMTSMGILMGAVNRVVPAERRSLAFGIIMSGGSIGQFLMIPFAQSLIATWDWRVTCVLLAVAAALIIPLAFGLREGSRPLPPSSGPMGYRAALREAFTHKGFLLITASFFVCGFHVNLISTHLPAFITDHGMSLNVAATALALVGLFNIFGSLAVGFLGGKYRQPYLLAGIYGIRTAVFLAMLLLPLTPILALVFSAAMGFLYLSTAAPTTAMTATIFGPKHFSMIYGFVFGSHQLGGFAGAWLGGRLFDSTGSYDAVWWMAVGLGVVATLLALPIRDEPIRRPAPA